MDGNHLDLKPIRVTGHGQQLFCLRGVILARSGAGVSKSVDAVDQLVVGINPAVAESLANPVLVNGILQRLAQPLVLPHGTGVGGVHDDYPELPDKGLNVIPLLPHLLGRNAVSLVENMNVALLQGHLSGHEILDVLDINTVQVGQAFLPVIGELNEVCALPSYPLAEHPRSCPNGLVGNSGVAQLLKSGG
ncbi:hypothetical protein ES703_59038 [subsurface metagenome]